MPRSYFADTIDETVTADFAHAVADLRRAGILIEEVTLDELAQLPALNAKGGISAVEAILHHRAQIAEVGAGYDQRVRRRIESGAQISAPDYVEILTMVAEMATGVAVPLSETLSSSVEASASWADSTYMDSYFGVSRTQSAKSGHSRYAADSGFKDVGIALGLNYMISEAVGVSGLVQYTRLVGDAADSPIVEDKGSADQFFTGMFLTYRFR